MNLWISIDEEIYRHAQNVSEDSNDEWNAMRAIANGTPIPDNATNEDIINTMFDRDMAYNIRCYIKNYMLMGEWLDAPYQKGGKE